MIVNMTFTLWHQVQWRSIKHATFGNTVCCVGSKGKYGEDSRSSITEGGLEIVNTINYLKPLKRVNKPGKACFLVKWGN